MIQLPTQAPSPSQASETVHVLSSSQAAPGSAGLGTHPPVVGSQAAPTQAAGSSSGQTVSEPPAQLPAEQVAPLARALADVLESPPSPRDVARVNAVKSWDEVAEEVHSVLAGVCGANRSA